MGKRELVALLSLSFWCLAIVVRLFLAVPRVYLQFVIVVFPDHTHLLQIFMKKLCCIVSKLSANSDRPKIVSEYDQEIPQSQTTDNPMTPRGRATQPSQDTKKTN